MPHGNRSRQREPRNPRPQKIRAFREAAGLSQTAAADLISSTLRTWQDWESGTSSMHPAFWELWCLKLRARAHYRQLLEAQKAEPMGGAKLLAAMDRISEESSNIFEELADIPSARDPRAAG